MPLTIPCMSAPSASPNRTSWARCSRKWLRRTRKSRTCKASATPPSCSLPCRPGASTSMPNTWAPSTWKSSSTRRRRRSRRSARSSRPWAWAWPCRWVLTIPIRWRCAATPPASRPSPTWPGSQRCASGCHTNSSVAPTAGRASPSATVCHSARRDSTTVWLTRPCARARPTSSTFIPPMPRSASTACACSTITSVTSPVTTPCCCTGWTPPSAFPLHGKPSKSWKDGSAPTP
ncbi:UNVERIFIED_ORG: hypothetical protein JN05_03955 [Zoogloea ramigera]